MSSELSLSSSLSAALSSRVNQEPFRSISPRSSTSSCSDFALVRSLVVASCLASTDESSFAPSDGDETAGDDGLPDALVAGLVGLVIFVSKFMIPIPFRPFDFSLEAALGDFRSAVACLDTKPGGFSHVV